MQIYTFTFMCSRHKPRIYLMYTMQLVTINSSLYMPCFGFLRLAVKSVADKMCKGIVSYFDPLSS